MVGPRTALSKGFATHLERGVIVEAQFEGARGAREKFSMSQLPVVCFSNYDQSKNCCCIAKLTSHSYLLTPVCVRQCFLRLLFSLKFLLHSTQRYGFSPEQGIQG